MKGTMASSIQARNLLRAPSVTSKTVNLYETYPLGVGQNSTNTAFMLRKLIDNEFVCGRLVAGQQLPFGRVLPDYRTHRGALSIRPWNKCDQILPTLNG